MNQLVMLAAKIDRCVMGDGLIPDAVLRRVEDMNHFCAEWHRAYKARYGFEAGPSRWHAESGATIDHGMVIVRVIDAGSVDDAGQATVVIGGKDAPITLHFNSGEEDDGGGFFLAEVRGTFTDTDASRVSAFDSEFGGAIARYLGRDTAPKGELLLLSKIHRARMVANDSLRKYHAEKAAGHMAAMLEAVERVNAIERREDGE